MAEQRRLRTASVITRPLVSVLPAGASKASVGGDEAVVEHPWRTWNDSKEREELAAHVGGGVFRVDGVPSGVVVVVETWEPIIGPKLIGGERRRVTQFLASYRDYFAFSMKELGTLKGPGIRIELASEMPIFQRPYRYSDMERDLIWSKTMDLLEAGLVEISHGEYASATVMPIKKDIHGNYTDRRMCGDYRPINRITKSDKYAMPTPEEIFDVVGLYHWLFLPFGLKNAPAEF
ncbi:unnamed protein product [Calypogeia fissa]